jgi:hypothetical protein
LTPPPAQHSPVLAFFLRGRVKTDALVLAKDRRI